MAIDLTKPIDVTSVNNTNIKYKKEIATLDMREASEILQHFSVITGVENSIVLTHMTPGVTNSRGYDGDFAGDKKLGTLVPRTLKVYPIVYEVSDEPERLRRTFISETRGSVETDDKFYRWLIDWCLNKASEELYDVIFSAERDDTTAPDDIANSFDGVETIITDAISDGDIAAGEGNYYDPGAVYTASNIGDLLLEQWRSAPATFRRKGGEMHLSEDMGDMYDDWYRAEHDAPPMVDVAGQPVLQGSNGKCKIIRHSNIANQRVTLTRPKNITYGVYKQSDMKSLKAFNSGNPYKFTATMKYVFGIQIAILHKSMFITNKLYTSSSSGS